MFKQSAHSKSEPESDADAVSDDATEPPACRSPETRTTAPRPVASATVRGLLVVCGTAAAGLGFLGVFVPVLPTTPFLLVAAFCYARSSQRLYDRLLATRGFGPLIREYRDHRTIPTRAKVLAVAMICITIGTTAWFAVPLVPVKVALGVVAVSVSFWLVSHPSRRQ